MPPWAGIIYSGYKGKRFYFFGFVSQTYDAGLRGIFTPTMTRISQDFYWQSVVASIRQCCAHCWIGSRQKLNQNTCEMMDW